MRGNKFGKSHIHILEPETLSRESRVTESAQEIVDSIPYICGLKNGKPMSTICQVYYLIVGRMFYKKWGGFRREHKICGTLYFLRI